MAYNVHVVSNGHFPCAEDPVDSADLLIKSSRAYTLDTKGSQFALDTVAKLVNIRLSQSLLFGQEISMWQSDSTEHCSLSKCKRKLKNFLEGSLTSEPFLRILRLLLV